LINKKYITKAVSALHKEFNLDNQKWVLDHSEIFIDEKPK
jgi:hypothetical protein